MAAASDDKLSFLKAQQIYSYLRLPYKCPMAKCPYRTDDRMTISQHFEQAHSSGDVNGGLSNISFVDLHSYSPSFISYICIVFTFMFVFVDHYDSNV